MRLTPVQRERLKSSEFYIELPAVGSHVGKCLISLINQEARVQRTDSNSNVPHPEGVVYSESGWTYFALQVVLFAVSLLLKSAKLSRALSTKSLAWIESNKMPVLWPSNLDTTISFPLDRLIETQPLTPACLRHVTFIKNSFKLDH